MSSSTAFTLDQLTLQAARHDDGRALRRLYDVLAPAVLGYARAQGAEDPDALANETLFRVLRDLATFEGGVAGLRSWVFTIAHNLIIDDRRRRGRRPTTVELDRARTRPDGSFVAETALDRVEMAETLGWVKELPDDQRAVLLLRVVADLSITEVAAIVGKSEGAVKALQHRARTRLRTRMTDSGVTRPRSVSFTGVV